MKSALIAVFFAIASAAEASAVTTSTPLAVTASVQANCVLRSPLELNFGVYKAAERGSAPLDAVGNVLWIACTKGSPSVNIALDNGQSFNGAHRNLRSTNGRDLVAYEIYTSANHSSAWNLVQTLSYVALTARPSVIAMYGRVFGGQRPKAGRYSDTLLALVNF